jgi:hypothetical protein
MKHHNVWGNEGIAPLLLPSELNVGEWSAFRPCLLTPTETARIPIAQEAGWAPEEVLTYGEEKTLLALPGVDSNSDSWVIQLVA